MTTAYRKVFVLGSGFSKSFCPSLPTLKDLDGRLLRPLESEFALLEQYCKDFAALCNQQPEYLKVEDIASVILSTQIFPGEEDRLRHETLKFQLLRFIQRSMRQHHPLAPAAAGTLTNFLSRCAHPQGIAGDTLLISFNYDLLPEEQMRAQGVPCALDYGIALASADAARSAFVEAPATLHLLKLHGSLNWYRLKGAPQQSDLRSACLVDDADPSYPLYQHDNPIFIPMAHAKDSYLRGSLFSLLWAKADYYLSLAEEIHFVGYGFPRTDINNLTFLLRHRARIRNVVVYEHDDPAELARLQRLFGQNVVVNQDARTWLSAQLNNN